jgi:hypothetical protein
VKEKLISLLAEASIAERTACEGKDTLRVRLWCDVEIALKTAISRLDELDSHEAFLRTELDRLKKGDRT